MVIAQEFEQGLGEEGVAGLAALGVRDPELVAVRLEIVDLDVDGFGEAQTATVDGGQEGLGAKIVLAAEGEKGFDFQGAEDAGKARLAFGTDDVREIGIAVTLQELAIERVDGVDGDVDGGGGELALGDEMEEPGFNLIWGEQVRRLVMEFSQVDNEGGVGLDGSLCEISQGEELHEFLA